MRRLLSRFSLKSLCILSVRLLQGNFLLELGWLLRKYLYIPPSIGIAFDHSETISSLGRTEMYWVLG